jgi:NADH:quinone reductase (non-electrogenic)
MVANDERSTELMFRSYRSTARVARNAVSVEAVRIEREGNSFEAIGHLVKGSRGKEALDSGDIEGGIWSAGMIQGLITDVPSVKVLIDRIMSDAKAIVRQRLNGALA